MVHQIFHVISGTSFIYSLPKSFGSYDLPKYDASMPFHPVSGSFQLIVVCGGPLRVGCR